MMAGSNDLLWDYSESQIPTKGPDRGLYYGAYVNDAPSTNLGLNGVKMNSSGYCYFTKAAVAGKLKLTFSPRQSGKSLKLGVWTWTGDEPSAQTLIQETATISELQTEVIELTAEQTNIYINRPSGTGEGVLQKIEFKEDVARSFVDFEMILSNILNPYEPAKVPAGVTFTGTHNTDQHGYRGFTITVPVDGTVKFTFGYCKYGNQTFPIKNKAGETLATMSYPAVGCYDKNKAAEENYFFSYNYLGAADTLTIGPIQYCPYFKAEATEITPCTITFKDQNGGVLGTVETIEGATLEAIPYTEADLPTIADTDKFRGWFYTSGKKANVGDPINGNTTIQAKVTPIETVTVGSIQTYDFTNPYFYPEDHETIDLAGGYYHDAQHGWAFKNGEGFAVQLAGKAVVVLEICQYGTAGAKWKNGTDALYETVPAVGTADGEQITIRVEPSESNGFYGLLTNTGGENYLHKITVYNVENFLEKDTTTGYIMVPSGDAAAFVLALAQAESGDKIFLPNGTYDLGETVLTTISKNNISIIGQSMDGVIIKNAPDAKTESIDKTATLRIAKNVTGTYIQDLTIQNALDYYKSDNGRAVALWDQGTKTVCKNVKLLSHQDTYYSNLQGAVKYFEDCEIHGTVDFICGDGSVYFKKNLLYCEKRKKDGGGSDALTANNGPASDRGYVFDSCVVVSECPVVSFGRAWNNTPSVAFLNTQVSYDAGKFSFESSDIQRWTKKLMNPNAWPKFGEYNTQTMDGTVLTPASNIVTFVDEKSGNATRDIETVLSAEQAAAFTMEYTLGSWAATAAADATQAVCEEQWADLEADAIYLAEANGEFVMLVKGSEVMDKLAVYDGVEYTLRKANARGGFGLTVEQQHEGVENTQAEAVKVQKIMRDGQVIIVRDGKEFNVLGAQL